MGFLTNILSTAVKTALTPIAIVKDVANVAVGNDPNSTKDLLNSAVKDFEEGFDDLGDGEVF